MCMIRHSPTSTHETHYHAVLGMRLSELSMQWIWYTFELCHRMIWHGSVLWHAEVTSLCLSSAGKHRHLVLFEFLD